MKNKKSKSTSITPDQSLIAAGLFLSFFVIWFLWAALGWPSLSKMLARQDAAAWVQAFGSISAILVTAYIARRDTRARNNEKEELHAKEMRRIAYHMNNSGLSEGLINFLTSSQWLENPLFDYSRFNYKNILFIYMTIGHVRGLQEVYKNMESSVVMELRTSVLCDDFFTIFNVIDGLNAQYNLNESLIIYDPDIRVVKNYLNFVNDKSTTELTYIDDELKFSIDFIKQMIEDLRGARASIKSSMNDPF